MKFLSDYFKWHYFTVWPKIIILWRNITLFPIYYFSMSLHLRTLFAPWKRQVAQKSIGFYPGEILGRIGFNLISRAIGGLIRLSTILYGLGSLFILSVLFFIPLVLWIFLPGISLIFYITRKPSGKDLPQFLFNKYQTDLSQLSYHILKSPIGVFVLSHLNVDPKTFADNILNQKNKGDSQLFLLSIKKRGDHLKFSEIFEALYTTYPPFRNPLEKIGIKIDDVYQTAKWSETLKSKEEKPLLFDLERIKSIPGIGTSWAYGYTVEFDKYSRDLNKVITPFPLLLGREVELEKLQQILMKTEAGNAIIIGEPGVARHRLVETLAHRILLGQCPRVLSHKRILTLDMHSLIASKPSPLEAKGLVSSIFAEAANSGNIIAVVDELDKYTTASDGHLDLSDIFTKYTESSLTIIGITTPGAYHRYIERNPSINAIFESVVIDQPSREIVQNEMEISIAPVLEKKYRIIITFQAIKKAIENSDRFITATPFPAKTIELLDQACVFLQNKKNEYILKASHIDEFLSGKFNIKIGEIETSEKDKLLHLEENFHARVIGQDEAIRVISSALRRTRLNVSSTNRPVGSFLFLGPTGVGKTETAKALAEIYFGSEDSMLRFDMSQYQKEEGMERLIGSIKTGTAGELSSQLIDHPFSLLLLDEFEKSEKEIYNIFLTLIDEGYITDSNGKKIFAKNNIVIATSNAGAEFIREKIYEGITGENLRSELIDYVQKEKIFSPELINRFDAVVVFTTLSEGNLREVARLQLESLNRRLAVKEVAVDISPTLIAKLAVIGFNPQFGGRAMRRTITEIIEDQVAKRLLAGNVKKGEKIIIDL